MQAYHGIVPLTVLATLLLLGCADTAKPTDVSDPGDPSYNFTNGPPAPSLAATRIHDRLSFTEPFNQIASSECLGEESLTITGTFHEEFMTVTRVGDPQPYHYELNDIIRGVAVSSSGTEYKFLVNEHQTLSAPDFESAHFTFSFPGQIRLIGTGGAPNLVIHFTEHTTVLPTGELHVDINEVRASCHT